MDQPLFREPGMLVWTWAFTPWVWVLSEMEGLLSKIKISFLLFFFSCKEKTEINKLKGIGVSQMETVNVSLGR